MKNSVDRPISPEGGFLLSELPDEFQATVKKEYYDRSPWASIQSLVNGKFLVHKHVCLTYIPANSWNEAKNIRDGLVSAYVEIERCFH